MIDPIADAAKLHEAIYDTVADAITVTSTADFEMAENLPERLIAIIANTRPQPAPVEGEPNFEKLWLEYSRRHDTRYDAAMILFGIEMYRLGLAARPRVEDAEVTKTVNDLREAGKVLDSGVTKILDAGFFVKAADILERLAKAKDVVDGL